MGEVSANLWTIWESPDGTRHMSPKWIVDRAKMREELKANDERNARIHSRNLRAGTGQGDEAPAHEEVSE